MPTITKISPQRSRKRVNIYLDDKFGFGIDLENFVTLNLRVEQELTTKELNKIIEKAEFQKTYNKLLRFATLRPRSEREVLYWLKRKKVHESIYKKLFSRLKKLELLNDEKFAHWWIEQRLTFKPRGERALISELLQKGVERDVIKSVLLKVDMDEEGKAKELLEKNKAKWDKLKGGERKRKVWGFLARKGFSWETIRKVT